MAFPLLAITVLFLLVNPDGAAQARPDLSGTWTRVGPTNMCSARLTLVQDDSSISVDTRGSSRPTRYYFDGSDARQVLAPPSGRPANLPPTAYHGQLTRSLARAAWNGQQFVVVTHSTMTMTWPSQTSQEFERETTRKEMYSVNSSGQLLVENQVVVDPLPGTSSQRTDMLKAWTCTYARGANRR